MTDLGLTIYLLLISLLFIFQRKIQYLPTGQILSLKSYGLDNFSEQIINLEDGIKIFSWYKKSIRADNKIILYLHGNSGNLGDRSYRYNVFAERGYGVLAISYRGYRKSTGKPSEEGLIKDGSAALEFLYNNGYKASDVMLYGESLGSGVAIQIAAKENFNLLVLESPYSSIASVAQKNYWYAPINLLLKDKFESIKYAPKIKTPTIIFHGKKDNVVSYKEGQKLFNSLNIKKDLIFDDNLGHVDFDPNFVINEIERFN